MFPHIWPTWIGSSSETLLLCNSLVRQEQELRNGSAMDKKLSTLADLFRPPIELMHKGSFETVRSMTALVHLLVLPVTHSVIS